MQISSTKKLTVENNQHQLSVYDDELTPEGLTKNIALISASFPDLDVAFYDVMIDLLKEKGFTDKRLENSVKHVISNCIYPRPTIAQFLSFDKKIDLYTYDDMMKKTDTDKDAFKRFLPIQLDDVSYTLWAHKNDVEKYNLKVKK